MSSRPNWAELAAARLAGDEPTVEETPAVTPRPAWARAAADRLTGRTPDPETVREARAGAHRPRAEWENRLLARLGHTDQNTDTE
jgi:hypothetical protein